MEPLLSTDDRRKTLLNEIQNLISDLSKECEQKPVEIHQAVQKLNQIRHQFYENLNQLQHEKAILDVADYLTKKYAAGEKIHLKWNPRQTGTALQPDLLGVKGNQTTFSAEITTSRRPIGTIASRMQSTLENMQRMDGNLYYFVGTDEMEKRARHKIKALKFKNGIEILRYDSLITSQSLLYSFTGAFLNDFWKKEMGNCPSWSNPWLFDDSLPNYDKKGCYALLEGDEVKYIGLALGKENGIGDNGIGSRVSRYWRKNKTYQSSGGPQYEPLEDFKSITAIITIGFPESYAYLAAALEVFLIQRIRPTLNIRHI